MDVVECSRRSLGGCQKYEWGRRGKRDVGEVDAGQLSKIWGTAGGEIEVENTTRRDASHLNPPASLCLWLGWNDGWRMRLRDAVGVNVRSRFLRLR